MDIPRYPPYDDSKLPFMEKMLIGPFLSPGTKMAIYGAIAVAAGGLLFRSRM